MTAIRSRRHPVAAWHPLDPGGAVPLGKAVREMRRRRDLSQEQLAAAIRAARETVGRIERGQRANPGLRLLTDLANALGVSVAVLVDAYIGSAATPNEPLRVPHDVAAQERAQVSNVHQLGSLDGTGPVGMGTTLRAFRVDLGAPADVTAFRARTHRRYLEAIEAGRVRSPGLLSVTRLAHAIGARESVLGRTALRVRLLAQVYAGEIDASTAIDARRHDRTLR